MEAVSLIRGVIPQVSYVEDNGVVYIEAALLCVRGTDLSKRAYRFNLFGDP